MSDKDTESVWDTLRSAISDTLLSRAQVQLPPHL